MSCIVNDWDVGCFKEIFRVCWCVVTRIIHKYGPLLFPTDLLLSLYQHFDYPFRVEWSVVALHHQLPPLRRNQSTHNHMVRPFAPNRDRIGLWRPRELLRIILLKKTLVHLKHFVSFGLQPQEPLLVVFNDGFLHQHLFERGIRRTDPVGEFLASDSRSFIKLFEVATRQIYFLVVSRKALVEL